MFICKNKYNQHFRSAFYPPISKTNQHFPISILPVAISKSANQQISILPVPYNHATPLILSSLTKTRISHQVSPIHLFLLLIIFLFLALLLLHLILLLLKSQSHFVVSNQSSQNILFVIFSILLLSDIHLLPYLNLLTATIPPY